MLPYIFVYLLLTILIVFDFEKKFNKIKPFGLLLSFIVLLIFVGLRDQTGTDWQSYKDNYDSVLIGGSSNPHFEFGYNVLVYIFSKLRFDYSAFLFFYSFLYLFLFYIVFYRSKNPNTLALLFYSTYLIGYMGAARQVLAMAICLNAFYYLYKNNNKKFFVLVLIAGSIHYPSLSFVAIYFFRKKLYYTRKNLFIFLLLTISSFYITPLILDFLSNFSFFIDQILNYIITGDNEPVFMIKDNFIILSMFIKRILLFYLFIYFGKIYIFDKYYIISLNSYLFGFFIFTVFYFFIPTVGVRLSLYFSIFDIILLSYLIDFKKSRLISLCLFFLFSLERLSSSLKYDADMIIPYKGLSYNESYHRNIRQ